jgi:cytochrome P450
MQSGEREITAHELMQCPHELYARLRQEGPAHRVIFPPGLLMIGGLPVWLVTRYSDVREILADPRLSTDVRQFGEVLKRHGRDPSRTAFSEALGGHMLHADPPQHTRLRGLVNKAFTGRQVELLRPRILEILDDLLDRMVDQDEVDFLHAFAFPFPITVIFEVLGVPAADQENFRTWIYTLVSANDKVKTPEAFKAIHSYISELITSKRATPGDDLVTALIRARDNEDRLSEAELVPMIWLLILGGHETTANLLGSGMLALLQNREQLAALRADPSLIPNAVEELLRYDGPAKHATFRSTLADMDVGGVTIPAGEIVLVSLSSGNRDSSHWPEANALDLTRATTGQLGFGHGVHYCVGAPLARLETQLAFGRILSRFPNISLAIDPSELKWKSSTLVRALASLPVRLH